MGPLPQTSKASGVIPKEINLPLKWGARLQLPISTCIFRFSLRDRQGLSLLEMLHTPGVIYLVAALQGPKDVSLLRGCHCCLQSQYKCLVSNGIQECLRKKAQPKHSSPSKPAKVEPNSGCLRKIRLKTPHAGHICGLSSTRSRHRAQHSCAPSPSASLPHPTVPGCWGTSPGIWDVIN